MTENDYLRNLGIEALSEMQRNAVELIRNNRDAVLLAPTGSGKTIAFLLPLVESVDHEQDEVQAIVLSPTRELTLQTLNVLTAMKSGLRAMCCYGGRPTMEEHRKMATLRPQIIIGTPGRLNDHIDKRNFDARGVSVVVVDEFDKMFELNFQDEVERLLYNLHSKERCVLVSATDMDNIPAFVGFGNRVPATLNYLVQEGGAVAKGVSHFVVHSDSKDKLDTLDRLLRSIGGEQDTRHACSIDNQSSNEPIVQQQSVVFVNYREAVERIGSRMKSEGHSVSLFHGGMQQDERERALALFRNGSVNVLVSTELSARGIDVPALRNVIHYHLPASYENYIHRCGRTGRWEADGRSFMLIGPEEEVPRYNVNFLTFPLEPPYPAPAKPKWNTLYIGRGKRDKLSKGDIVGFLCKTGGIKAADIGMIDIKERYAHVAVRRSVTKQILHNVAGEKIKKMATKIELLKAIGQGAKINAQGKKNNISVKKS